MAASNRHRKLLQDTTSFIVIHPGYYCTPQCNLQLNPTGLCVPGCLFICPSICRIIDSSLPPSSSFSPATSPYPSTSSPTTEHHHPSLSLPLRISLIFLFVTFSLFFLYTLCKFYTLWYRSRRHRTPPSSSPENYGTNGDEFVDHPIWYIRTTGLETSVINAISVVKFDKDGGVVEGSDCSVCLSEFEADETLRLLPNCKHAFHVSCIDTWLRSHTNCPLCRAGIVDNTVDLPSPEQNRDDVGLMGEIDLGISMISEDDNGGEDSESSELRIGETEVLIRERSSELLIIRRSGSVDGLEVSDPHEITLQSVDGDLGIESVKIDQTTDDNHSMRDGK
ncbi:hypothetical protein L6452_01273 [Arctium lappa]|uniref:Uncharacterized protein n=1 Tax=Arctium lappa TaxID=4217 RepID=A0ACB9FGM9_ARCLA|nr:hypothetical protein L6452_01273 [Arctium lappa]